jgi:hypothetical protein
MWVCLYQMIKQEKQVLFKEKIKEGKSEEIARDEIKRDIDYCKNSKKIIKARLIDSKKLKEDKNKQFKEAFKRLTKRKPKFYNSENHQKLYIKRILNRLTESPAIQNQLSKDCCIPCKKVLELLSLLIKQKKVKANIKERGTIYEIA